jgi:hypothetical protein
MNWDFDYFVCYTQMSCRFSDIFGRPNTGVHKKRINIFGVQFAYVDTVLTIVLIFVLTFVLFRIGTAYEFFRNLFVTTICVLVITIAIHKLFCVDTTLNKLLGL